MQYMKLTKTYDNEILNPLERKRLEKNNKYVGGINKIKCLLENNLTVIDKQDIKDLSRIVPDIIKNINIVTCEEVVVDNMLNLSDLYGKYAVDKIFGVVKCQVSSNNKSMKYYLSFRKTQDIFKLKDDIYKTALKNGDIQIIYHTYHEFKFKSEMYSYTLESTYTKSLGDVYELTKKILNLTNLRTGKVTLKKAETTRISSNQFIKPKVIGTTMDMLKDLSITLGYCIDNKITVKTGIVTREIKDQYLDNFEHPNGTLIFTLPSKI